jgi:hypothetical protein
MTVTGRVVLIERLQVGKTSLIHRFLYGEPSTETKSTIGAVLHTQDLTVADQRVTLQMWDTAGQEQHDEFVVVAGNQSDLYPDPRLDIDSTAARGFDAECIWSSASVFQRSSMLFPGISFRLRHWSRRVLLLTDILVFLPLRISPVGGTSFNFYALHII